MGKSKDNTKNIQRKNKPDIYIILCVIGFVLFGIIMVYSASYYTEQLEERSGFTLLLKQAVGALVGFAAMFLASKVNYKIYAKPAVAYGLMGVAVLLLGLVLVPGIGISSYGARRWFRFPVIGQFQPSEIAKIALIVYMSYFMSKNRWWANEFTKGWLPLLGALGLIAGLIMLEPNFSTTILICLLGFVMLILGGAQAKYCSLLVLGGLGGAGILMFSSEYRRQRFLAFTDPFKYRGDEAYQLVQSLYAFGDGGLFGVGLGQSRQKFGSLPFCESDFILSIIGEELGLVGVLILMAAFVFFICRGMRVAMNARDRFGMLLAAGITSVIAIQVLINIAVVTGSIPPTGLPLPFISKGNTSLVILLAMVGVLLNISKQPRQ